MRSVGHTTDGIYVINPDGKGRPFQVFCNQGSNGGAWVVIQRRLNGSVNFYREWKDYKEGFGDLNGEFWLGLEKIARLTNQTGQKLRVEMKDFKGHLCFVEYNGFVVNGEREGYRLAKLGEYRGMYFPKIAILSTSGHKLASDVTHVYIEYQAPGC